MKTPSSTEVCPDRIGIATADAASDSEDCGHEHPQNAHDPGGKHLPTTNLGRYRPEINGLRAVAVLAVLLFKRRLSRAGRLHRGRHVLRHLWILDHFAHSQGSWYGHASPIEFLGAPDSSFFPAQAVLVGVVLILGMLLLLPADLFDLCKSAVAQSVLLSNVYWLRHLGYFDGTAEIKPLLHMWSLAVEEQFYVGFPLFLVVCVGGCAAGSAGFIRCNGPMPNCCFRWSLLIAGLLRSQNNTNHTNTVKFKSSGPGLAPIRVIRVIRGSLLSAVS